MTFNEVLNKFRAESFTQKDKGTQFERLMRSWLLSDPRYSNLTEVWMWEDFPSKKDFGGKDTGIDLVARTDTGEYWAIQCKCYQSPIGVKAVQEAYAGRDYYDRMVGAVLTNQYFTAPAVEAAKKLKILLWDRGYLERMMEE